MFFIFINTLQFQQKEALHQPSVSYHVDFNVSIASQLWANEEKILNYK